MLNVDADASNCYITTAGRVTGRPHTVEIWFGLEGLTLYVLAGGGHNADFVRNAAKRPAVTVRVGSRESREMPATARIVLGGDEDALARRLLLEKYTGRFDDDLDEWGRAALVVAFDLQVE